MSVDSYTFMVFLTVSIKSCIVTVLLCAVMLSREGGRGEGKVDVTLCDRMGRMVTKIA